MNSLQPNQPSGHDSAPGRTCYAEQNGRGQPHSKTLRSKDALRPSRQRLGVRLSSAAFLPLLILLRPIAGHASSPNTLFQDGITAYNAGDFARATTVFREAAATKLASGTLQNLGNAEWQQGERGPAIVAWEQALWLNPFSKPARNNLSFARKNAQLEAPELLWHEVISTWLPADWWAWIACVSFWLVIGLTILPVVFRSRKTAWHQALAAFGLMLFLLSIPAQLGIYSRSKIGFILRKDTPLRLAPVADAELDAAGFNRLPEGTPARWLRARGKYVLINVSHHQEPAWVEQTQFGLICPQ